MTLRQPRIRITIEYDPDWPDEDVAADPAGALANERQDWLDGHVNISDLDPSEVKFEVIP